MLTRFMQRWISLILALFTSLSLVAVGCGGDDDGSGSSTSSSSGDGGDTDGSTSSSSSSSSSSGGDASPDTGTPDGGADAQPDAPAATYTVGGQVTGLGAATGLVLQLNGSNNLPINGDGGFVFPVQLLNGSSYSVTISSQPDGKTCTVSAGSGTIQSQHVSSVVVNCASDAFTIGGNVTGLAPGASVTLTNGGANLTVTQNGSFAFPTTVNAGATYNVTVSTQPSAPTQVCTVTNGSGTVSTSNVTDIAVTCVTSTFTVGGTVNGLSGGTVTLQINGGETQAVSQNGPWSFPTALASGTAYEVTVLSHPTGPAQTCTVSGGSGTVAGANVTTVVVDCSGLTFTVGGNLTGLGAGKSIVLANGADTLTLDADGAFTFPTAQNSGTNFNVTITTQPQDQTCVVSGGNGTIGSANVTSVVVNCDSSLHTIGGTITGLNGTLVLNNGTETQTISTNAAGAVPFSFPTPVASGTAYTVTVDSQPTFSGGGVNQTCTVTNGTGTVAAAPVTDIAVTCVTNSFTLAGHVHGLQAGATVTLLNNGGDARAVVGSGSSSDTFTFATKVPSGAVFNVSVQGGSGPAGNTTGSPVEQLCLVTSGASATMADGDVANVVVECTTVSHTVAVNVTGLATGSSVTVQNVRTATAATPTPGNNVETSPALTGNGVFTFNQPVFSGQDYAVSVVTQPVFNAGTNSGANQTCTVDAGNASGTIGNLNVQVTVTCVTNRFSVSALLSGLDDLTNPGTNTVTVQLRSPPSFPTNPANDVTRNQNGAFGFLDPDLRVLSGEDYTLEIVVQPNNPLQTCRFASNGTNTFSARMGNGAVTGILINCDNDRFSVGGTVSGLHGQLTLRNVVGGPVPPADPPDDLETIPNTNGPYTFDVTVQTTKTYTVSVDQPPQFAVSAGPSVDGVHQDCTVANNNGTIVDADINNVNVTCTTLDHSVTGTVNGLLGAATQLQLSDGVNTITVGAAGNFTFPARPSGSTYAVSVTTQPANIDQICTVDSQGDGVTAHGNYIQNGDVTGVVVNCVRRSTTINAVVHGLSTGTVTVQNVINTPASTSPLSFPASGSNILDGTFPVPVNNGSTYNVTVTNQPGTDQYCTVVNGTGTIPESGTPTSRDVHIYCGITCRGIHLSRPGDPSGTYLVDGDGNGSAPAANAYCDMANDGGGWTLVLKVDPNSTQFQYSSGSWTNTTLVGSATQQASFDTTQAKANTFNTVAFDAVRAMLRDTVSDKSVILPQNRVSFHNLMNAGTTNTNVGRAAWIATLANPSGQLQAGCNAEGFNIAVGNAPSSNYARVRIGIVGNQTAEGCASPDSWLGIGGQLGSSSAANCSYPDTPNTTSGNVSPNDNSCGIGNPPGSVGRETEAWGFVWVR